MDVFCIRAALWYFRNCLPRAYKNLFKFWRSCARNIIKIVILRYLHNHLCFNNIRPLNRNAFLSLIECRYNLIICKLIYGYIIGLNCF